MDGAYDAALWLCDYFNRTEIKERTCGRILQGYRLCICNRESRNWKFLGIEEKIGKCVESPEDVKGFIHQLHTVGDKRRQSFVEFRVYL